MKHGFFRTVSPDKFRSLLAGFPPLGPETVALADCLGRVLAADVIAGEDLPLCNRSSMDGFAVRAADLFGAGESNPAYLECVGDIDIQTPPDFDIVPGQCAGITTGGCLPEGADSVVMIEHTQIMGAGTIEVRRAVAPGENVMFRGEDARAGKTALAKGRTIRPQEAGLLAALGVVEVEVHKKPTAAIISTGDELVPVEETPLPGQVRDVNTSTLSAILTLAGARPLPLGLVGDELDDLVEALKKGLDKADLVLLSGGSSVGVRDLTIQAIEAFDDSEILAHGVSIAPGKPTILARIGVRPVIGLPGQVTSAQVVMHVFGQPFARHLQGDARAFDALAAPRRQAELARNLASKQGREDWVRVRLEERPDAPPLAHPILGKSGLLKTLVSADALVVVDADREGLTAGTRVVARLL